MHDYQLSGDPEAARSLTTAAALRHGLTSRQPPPLSLTDGQLDEFRERFRAEYQPIGVAESSLVDELAGHAFMLKLAERAEVAVLRHGAQQLSGLVLSISDVQLLSDAALTAAVSSDSLERLTRYRRAHERAFLSVLNKLEQLRSSPRVRPAHDAPPVFSTEHDCRHYLRRRFSQPEWRCPRCGSAKGSWLRARWRWECGHCRVQTGLRTGQSPKGLRCPC